MNLVEFLTQRIADDEAVARAATPGPWEWEPPSGDDWPMGDESLLAVRDEWTVCPHQCAFRPGDPYSRGERAKPGHEHRTTKIVLMGWGHDSSGIEAEPGDRAHIASHDPTRVLADCAARRAVVDALVDMRAILGRAVAVGRNPTHMRVAVESYEHVVRCLAAVYDSHPDYDERWRP